MIMRSMKEKIMYDDFLRYVRLVRACSTVATFLYGREVYLNIGPGGVLTLYDHIPIKW